MVIDKSVSQLNKKQDFTHILILLAVALGIGIYLIVTTTMIAKDGVFYIERAQQLISDPIKIIKAHPPGYPFLILIAHKCAALFADDSSIFTWIYSAQSVTLLCRLLAIIPLYFMGKLLVGGKNSFWAILILTFLPFSTKFACDVIREWPYLLFLATSFFFLLWGAKYGKWWAFGFVGLSSGLGYLIRPESSQFVVYGFLWVALSMFKPKLWNVSRWKTLLALAILVIGFAIPTVPYMKCTGRIVPRNIKRIMQSFSFNSLPDSTDVSIVKTVSSNYDTAEIVPSKALVALGEIFKTIGENLMWFFLPALVIGFYYHFRYNAKREELFLIAAFILVNVTLMILRYSYIQLTVSKRWSMPLITFTIFYIPIGLSTIAGWLSGKNPKNNVSMQKNKQQWFLVLLVIGMAICLPKLLRPLQIHKQGYLGAAKWLKENTKPEDIIAVPDDRISFYAERKGLAYEQKASNEAEYIVMVLKDEDQKLKLDKSSTKTYSGWVDKRKKKKRIVIYKVL